ncbi:ATP-dependent helicase [Blastopirellula marina]|uniref:DNA 3'-5' helicase n=1 Tax=Blastopirellula marina DSM 3645 TaxID=314230 RepID=A4A1X2_9BACT|nr:UvrD-helicase domain-containing protein [Blastopirellula marina]EAQ77206.1 ATP-dependent DNA helicase [Blastopirellula marina DSM 3645]
MRKQRLANYDLSGLTLFLAVSYDASQLTLSVQGSTDPVSGLNQAQLDAVNTLSGPMLVLAGAGSGKTRVVTFRIANLIKHGVRPSRILAVTFTNKAAAEMRERALGLLGKKATEQPVVSTFHSHCVRVLRRHINRLGYPLKFAIYDRGDQESVIRAALREIRVPNESLRPGDALNNISRWKTAGIRPAEAVGHAQTDKEHLSAMAYRRYQNSLKTCGAVDFDDLLLLTEELFTEHDDIRDEEASQFDHLMIDEYQDTNGSQYRIVRGLAEAHRNLCVVGDDDQSIYSWRGAEVQHILRFQHDWPEAKVIYLKDNYRCTAAILELANRLIQFNSTRYDKDLEAARFGGERPQIWQFKDEEKEAEEVVKDIARKLSEPEFEPRDFAILFRTNEQPRAFEQQLRSMKIPYILIGGMSFFDRKEVRDLISYLKVIHSPIDEVSLLRILNTPPRGIGQQTVKTLMDTAVTEGVPLWEVFPKVRSIRNISENAANAVIDFSSLIRRYQKRFDTEPMSHVVRSLIGDIRYQKELERLYPDPNDRESREMAIEQVVNAVSAFETNKKKPTLGGFLDDSALSGGDFDNEKEKQLQRNGVVLMTLHAAKGLEFPNVYLVGMEEGILPHARSVKEEGAAVEEERRLCYVGITRAQDRLTFSLATSRKRWGKPRPTDTSRFLYEITGQAENAAKSAQMAKSPRDRVKSAGKRG